MAAGKDVQTSSLSKRSTASQYDKEALYSYSSAFRRSERASEALIAAFTFDSSFRHFVRSACGWDGEKKNSGVVPWAPGINSEHMRYI